MIKQKLHTFFTNIWTKRALLTFGLVVFLVVAATLLTLFLEYRHLMGDVSGVQNFVKNSPNIFIFNSLLMFLMLVFLTGITGKPIINAGLLFSFLTLLTFAHINKFASRDTPLLPEDFEMASELAALFNMISAASLFKILIAIALALFVTITIQYFIDKKFTRALKMPKFITYSARLVMIVASAWFFMSLTADIRNRTGESYQRWEFLGRETNLVAWNQRENYLTNGFMIGFLYNLSAHKIEQPENYSAETIQKIKQKYQATAEIENSTRLDPADENINLVLVLCESCVDMKDLEKYYTHTGGDITPNLHEIQKKYPHGEMFSPEYGGGTANIEFEILTSFSNYFYGVTPFVHMVSKNGQSISAASMLNRMGYQSIGLHAYYPTMYKRNIAYKNLGFSNFYGFEDFTFQNKNGNSAYVNDASSYQETLLRMESTDQKMLISLVTMENHSPYYETYDEHNFISTATIDGVDHNQLENYYESLHNSDLALGDFINALDNFDEKTAVLFYGDHLPGAIDSLPEEALLNGLRHKTPFFFYANFDIGEAQYLGTFSPNYLFGMFLDALNFQKGARAYLTDDLKKSIPILTRSFYYNHQPESVQQLIDYELVGYDLLFGKRYWIKE
ncbi:MAG: LTA synthase family protein [Candidatus Nomurabacteria bacterium]|nr:LTA synthase family protein [Candidatus Nomurabacteria bacterium]